MYRQTYVKINNKILTDNVKKIINTYNEYKYYIGVVKANAYGHGDYIVNDLIKGGINYLAVSSLEEAVSIRKYNKDIPILCLEPISLLYLKDIIQNNVTITVEDTKYVKDLVDKLGKEKIKVHLKLDTGMSRLGFKDKNSIKETVDLIKMYPNILLEGIYTHLSTSGFNDKYYDKQINNFKDLTSLINLSEIEIVHLNRSITLKYHEKLPFETGTRLGIIMYGFDSNLGIPTGIRKIKRDLIHKINKISPSIKPARLDLHSAYALYTEVISLRNIKKGDIVGYGANYIAKEDMIVATLPIGYADGMNKLMKYVMIGNQKYEIIGDICMDMTLIKVDNKVKLNDKVEVFGDNISIRTVAQNTNTNSYHVLTSITTRVPRIYDNNKEIKY